MGREAMWSGSGGVKWRKSLYGLVAVLVETEVD